MNNRVVRLSWPSWLSLLSTAILSSFYVSADTSGSGNIPNDDQLYERYTHYPEYCSIPTAMEQRAIPPLPPLPSKELTTRLEKVTAIIRHGARTPVHTKHCWSGHWDAPDGIWDCQLKTLLSTRPVGYGETQDDDLGQFYVEKIYDALSDVPAPNFNRNVLNGTCQSGQLIAQGYDQQITNGNHLRNAYIYDDYGKDTMPPPPRLKLMSTSAIRKAIDDAKTELNNGGKHYFLDEKVALRSDDDQRTLASGQVLLSSMFQPEAVEYRKLFGVPPVMKHHTADRERDILSRYRSKDCPKQTAAIARAYESPEYKDFIESKESQTMLSLIENELEPKGIHFGGIDCLMTSFCTDRSLPEVLNDYKIPVDNDSEYTTKYGPNRFERLIHFIYANETFKNTYNDAELSKMDMGPLWLEILEQPQNTAFHLVSGHDWTIIPLLASLGSKIWNATDFPPYASMVLIEIHTIVGTGGVIANNPFHSRRAFRLVYNGKVLTSLLDGCQSEEAENLQLCDVSVLFDRIKSFATRENQGCGSDDEDNNNDNAAATSTLASFDTGIITSILPIKTLIFLMFVSSILGSLVTCLVMKRLQSRSNQQGGKSELVSMANDLELSSSTEEGGYQDEPDVLIT